MRHIEPIKKIHRVERTRFDTIEEKINEIAEVLNSLTEKKLPVECECEEKMVRVVYDRIKSDEVEINGDTYIRKGEPEKTAESEIEKEIKQRIPNWIKDPEFWVKDMADLLTSHTEQKKEEWKKELMKEIMELPDESGVYESKTISYEGVLHLIKEL